LGGGRTAHEARRDTWLCIAPKYRNERALHRALDGSRIWRLSNSTIPY